MKNNYTNDNIDKFYEQFKRLPEYFELEKVHQLIKNPEAMAKWKGKTNYKPLKIIIMTSALIIGLSTLIWLTPGKENESKTFVAKNSITKEYLSAKPEAVIKPNKTFHEPKNGTNAMNPSKKGIVQNIETNAGTAQREIRTLAENKVRNMDNYSKTCAWPSDTVIDKNVLLLELSDEELKNIGIARKGVGTFYHNICPNGHYNMSYRANDNLIAKEEKITTHNDYFVAHLTNPYFEPDGSDMFYSSMDTLVPVVLHNKPGQIFWFSPHDNFFKSLPSRYNYLKSVYDNLRCLKKNYPTQTFTNYLSNGSESILEPIKILELNTKDIINIGVGITDECVLFQSKNKKFTLQICKNSESITGSDEDFSIFPPNPYPVAMTDSLGRRIYVQSTIIKKDSLSKIMNILIPVKINLNKLAPQKKGVIICWYFPTEEFVNSLPQNVKPMLKSELNNILNKTEVATSSCNYFEICKSTLNLEDLKVYPNPAKNTATIEFNSSENVVGTISIVNIAGIKLKAVLSKTTFIVGHNSFQINLSGITPGIYLISINADKRFITQRLIVSQ